MKSRLLLSSALIAATLVVGVSRADAAVCTEAPDVLILLDRSGSMKSTISGQSKWSWAKTEINNVAGQLQNQLNLGLMLFPAWPHVSNCTAGSVNVDPGTGNASAIAGQLNSAVPDAGNTPIVVSLDAALTYFTGQNPLKPYTPTPGRERVVVLITDGADTCSGSNAGRSPADITLQLSQAGIKTYVVGYDQSSGCQYVTGCVQTAALEAAAANGGTNYLKADNPGEVETALKQIAAELACCGNGIIDNGESCDGNCSASVLCPAKECYSTTLNPASADACNPTCNYNAVAGCVPQGECNDGTVGAGEACDPQATGTCAQLLTQCNDGNSCTVDSLDSSIDPCNPICKNELITGCNPNPVPETPAYCRDGNVDPGELCDPGATGFCMTDAQCDDGVACTQDSADNSDPCNPKCSNVDICSDLCGNYQVDSITGETCDTKLTWPAAGACPELPVHCDDSDPTTIDGVLNAQTCYAACTHTPTTTTGPTCGNGTVDPGEWCDGNCPTSDADCNKGDSCTLYTLQGTGCMRFCAEQAITWSANGDGCCPAGATSLTDSDCPGGCGNGVLEPQLGEECDPKILSGEGACIQACDDNDSCTVDTMTGGACAPKCNFVPVGPNTVSDGCCPAGMDYFQDPDCPRPCEPDVKDPGCINPCASVNCPDGQYCTVGKCIPWPEETDPDPIGSSLGGNQISGGCDCQTGTGSNGLTGLLSIFGLALLLRRRRRR
jgi:MYXO-CTERM domain-containing protein